MKEKEEISARDVYKRQALHHHVISSRPYATLPITAILLVLGIIGRQRRNTEMCIRDRNTQSAELVPPIQSFEESLSQWISERVPDKELPALIESGFMINKYMDPFKYEDAANKGYINTCLLYTSR